MKRTLWMLAAIAALTPVATARAGDAAATAVAAPSARSAVRPPRSTPAVATAPAPDAAGSATLAAGQPAASGTNAKRRPKAATRSTGPATTARKAGAAGPLSPRSLDDIHIEGEVAVPQVLFITARDQRRFLDLEHRRYLKSALEIGEATLVPTRIALIRTSTDAGKETSR